MSAATPIAAVPSSGKAGKATAPGATGKASPAGAAAAAPRHAFLISPEKFNLTEQVANRWTAVVPVGTLPEDLDMKPGPFDLIAQLLHKGDDIRAFSADDSVVFDLIVVHRAGMQAWCRVTQMVVVPTFNVGQFPPGYSSVPEGFEIVEATRGETQEGWLIRRLADGVVLNAGAAPIYEHQQALNYLLNHPSVRGQTPQTLNRPVLT